MMALDAKMDLNSFMGARGRRMLGGMSFAGKSHRQEKADGRSHKHNLGDDDKVHGEVTVIGVTVAPAPMAYEVTAD